MKTVLILTSLVALTLASPQFASQYRYQDELGQHAFGHVGGPNSREEVKTADGITRGSYSYVDANGLIQSAVYTADSVNGFRVAATNIPVGPVSAVHPYIAHPYHAHPYLAHYVKKRSVVALPADTPEVAHAKAAQLIQQNTEAIRNSFHSAVPLSLPADTPEVAAAKTAHAVAHLHESTRHYVPVTSYAAPLPHYYPHALSYPYLI